MYGFLYRLGTWLLQKVAIAVIIAVVALVGVGAWLYLSDQVDVETRRQEYIAELEASRAEVAAMKAQALAEAEEFKSALATQRARIQQADKIIANLRALESWWERLWGNAEQQEENARQIQRMEALKLDSTQRIEELTENLRETVRTAEDYTFQLASIEKDLVGTAQSESATSHYVRNAWNRSRDYLLIGAIVYFFGPTVVKLLAYFLLAPLLSRGKAIHFDSDSLALPHVRKSAVSTEVGLWPGEVLRVKEKFLQASDEDLIRKTRFVFDWAIPVTSLACGLYELVELRNGKAGERSAMTLSNDSDPHAELSVIEVPEGSSIILRPSYLVGVITANEDKVEIRRRWTILRWQAWITLQFRFFEFVGPCRLVVAGSRGVRAETLQGGEGRTRPARRTNQRATIGFTPSLDYLPVRAETFWGYYRNMNPLFDDLFVGDGLFVMQETGGGSAENKPARFWSTLWNSMLKVFGI